ncbi:hypothetical protein AUJ65_02630 [Candidatus Micrarchaeota archaeon CG1_02_51_15]|nr:MAG: hypothetical protein AUJ65_02630 [Candidatus Micrarchaeota archaeon CG1_02_51_15]
MRTALVSIAFALLLLAPLALALDSTPSPAAEAVTERNIGCALDSMTREQTQAFWDATFSFQGSTITDANDRILRQNQTQSVAPPNNTNGSVTPPVDQLVFPLRQTAQSLGLDPQSVSSQTGIPVNGSLTYEQVRQVAENRGVGGWQQLLSQVLPQRSTESTTQRDTGQVTLPNGRKMLVSDLTRLQAMNSENCALDNADISGTISYIGLTGKVKDYDLAIGFHRNQKILETPQHLTTEEITGAVSWGNNGANIIIPHSFEKWLKSFSTINTIDLVTNTALGIYVYTSKSRIRTTADLDKDMERISARKQNEGIYGRGTAEEINVQVAQRTDAEQRLAALRAANAPVDQITTAEQAVTNLQSRVDFLNSKVDSTAQREIEDELARQQVIYQQGAARYLDDYDAVFKVLSKRVSYGFILGSLWLGPARFAYQINDAISLTSRGMSADKRQEYYLKMYVNKDVAESFRTSTDFLGMGRILEVLSGAFHINAPEEAFRANSYYLINIAEPNEEAREASTTSVNFRDGAWQVQTLWPHPATSTLTAFEKVSPSTKVSAMSFETSMLPADAIVEGKELTKHAAVATIYGLPFIMTFKLTQIPGRLMTLVPQLLLNQQLMKIDHDKFKNVQCDDKVIDKYIAAYGTVVALSNVINFAPVFGTLKTAQNLEKFKVSSSGFARAEDVREFARTSGVVRPPFLSSSTTASVLRVVDAIQLPQVLQMYLSSRAMEYVSSCKDNNYKILTYQTLPTRETGTLGQTLAQAGSQSPLAGNASFRLNVLDAVRGMGERILETERPELLHLNAVLEGQEGIVQPDELYYLELSNANLEWWNSFEQQCFRMCFDSPNQTICVDGVRGVYVQDRATGEITQLASADRARLQELATPLGRDIIPNDLIYSQMSCGSNRIMQADSSATLSITDASCQTTQCIVAKLAELTRARVDATDLTPQLGKVQRVHTTEGQAVLSEAGNSRASAIRFIRSVETTQERTDWLSPLSSVLPNETVPAGTELQLPAPEALANASLQPLLDTSVINFYGDGRVTAYGASASGASEQGLGTLVKIQTERGRIDFDRASNRLIVTVYILAELPVSQINGIQSRVACDEIRIDRVIPKAGIGDEAAAEFNRALQQIQQECGFAILETQDKRYYFHKDENGNDVLDVLDKATGEWTRYNRTGPMRLEGNDIVVPTDQGDVRFNISQDPQSGRPILQVTFPDGNRDIGDLIAARGQEGAIYFDPRTGRWYAYNGQDIPLDSSFAQRGAAFYQTDNGIVGQPSSNFLANPARSAVTSQGDMLSLLGLPAWPEPSRQPFAFAAMLVAIIAGVFAVRFSALRR